MRLDFAAIKQISLVEVVSGRYKIPLRFRGDHAMAPCPLPTHKDGDKGRSFSINIPGNYWRCFSDSCVANNGGKRGGDVINFVALMENCREKDAAQKLADWFNVGKEKAAPHMEKRLDTAPKSHTQTTNKQFSTSPDKGNGYMREVGAWLDDLLKAVPSEEERKVMKKLIMGRIHESYQNGKKASSPA